MDFSQLNDMYIITKINVSDGSMKIVGLFRGKENADNFIKDHASGEFAWTCNRVVTDF